MFSSGKVRRAISPEVKKIVASNEALAKTFGKHFNSLENTITTAIDSFESGVTDRIDELESFLGL